MLTTVTHIVMFMLALAAAIVFVRLAKGEGIIAAFESCHAVAHALKMADRAAEGTVIVVNLSGRGDKDVSQAQALLGALS